jgi:hypothetical protein
MKIEYVRLDEGTLLYDWLARIQVRHVCQNSVTNPTNLPCANPIKKKNSVAWVREWSIPSDRRLSAKLVPAFADRGCCMVSTMNRCDHILSFPDWSHYFFYQVAPQLYSRDWVDPVPDPLLLRKSGSAGNWTRASGSVARNSSNQTTEAATSLVTNRMNCSNMH